MTLIVAFVAGGSSDALQHRHRAHALAPEAKGRRCGSVAGSSGSVAYAGAGLGCRWRSQGLCCLDRCAGAGEDVAAASGSCGLRQDRCTSSMAYMCVFAMESLNELEHTTSSTFVAFLSVVSRARWCKAWHTDITNARQREGNSSKRITQPPCLSSRRLSLLCWKSSWASLGTSKIVTTSPHRRTEARINQCSFAVCSERCCEAGGISMCAPSESQQGLEPANAQRLHIDAPVDLRSLQPRFGSAAPLQVQTSHALALVCADHGRRTC